MTNLDKELERAQDIKKGINYHNSHGMGKRGFKALNVFIGLCVAIWCILALIDFDLAYGLLVYIILRIWIGFVWYIIVLIWEHGGK